MHASLDRLMLIKESYSAVVKVDITSLCLYCLLMFARLTGSLSLMCPIIGLPLHNAIWHFNDDRGY